VGTFSITPQTGKDRAVNVTGGTGAKRPRRAKGKGKTRRDGDWDCSKCGAMIFASKDTCFKCGLGLRGQALSMRKAPEGGKSDKHKNSNFPREQSQGKGNNFGKQHSNWGQQQVHQQQYQNQNHQIQNQTQQYQNQNLQQQRGNNKNKFGVHLVSTDSTQQLNHISQQQQPQQHSNQQEQELVLPPAHISQQQQPQQHSNQQEQKLVLPPAHINQQHSNQQEQKLVLPPAHINLQTAIPTGRQLLRLPADHSGVSNLSLKGDLLQDGKYASKKGEK
jgi:hypothetical protein